MCYVDTIVTAWLDIGTLHPEFTRLKLKLESAMKVAFHDRDIEVLSVIGDDHSEMQLMMSAEALSFMYSYAIHAPGLLAGFGITGFQAVGRYVCVDVQPAEVHQRLDKKASRFTPIHSKRSLPV